ncbi:ABC transporter permease [Humibacter ginsenosidimutans]|uniref:ABC transporter permease n=1 Tax=Humibacter ginsenosidimutans TaxID=2599293 RepID=A0A5B8M9S1_9MICO|nr:ABC transporter permease [Humibacter ginsenosidimutans]
MPSSSEVEQAVGVSRAGRRSHPLLRYLGIRFGISVLLLWGVTVITFVLANLVPANPAAAALGEKAASDPKVVQAFNEAHGFDKPVVVQYFIYLGNLLRGNLGTSTQTHNPVTEDLGVAFPATIELALFVIVFSIIIGLGLGLIAALRHNRFSDQIIRVFSLIGISIPTFWLAVAFFFVFFYLLGWAPGTGRLSPAATAPPHVTGMYTVDSLLAGQWDTFGDALSHLILPGAVLTLYTVGLLVRFTRSGVLDVLSQDYVKAARAKGLPAHTVVFRYILRGSLLPILTIVGLAFGSLLSGTVLTEQVFNWGGIGQYAYKAATTLDLPAIMGVGLIVGVVYIAINFVIDVVYGFIDPRVRVR